MRAYRTLLLCAILLLNVQQHGLAYHLNRSEPLIRVGLSTQQRQVNLSADCAFYLFFGESSNLTKPFSANQIISLANQEGRLTVNGVRVEASTVRVGLSSGGSRGHGDRLEHLVEQASNVNQQGGHVKIEGKRYRGVFEIKAHGKAGLTVVNILPLENYLYGVIPKEISPAWPLEAIKAQAVAARSYAFASAGKHQDQGFDVCSTVHCQVYGGRDSEAERSNQAIDATRGMMVTYKDVVITAFFHSSSGGHTENSENIWGTQFPYLRGVTDFDQQSPRFSWERRISAAKLSGLLKASGKNIGSLTVIELSPLSPQPIFANDRGVSGRVKSISLTGPDGKVQLSGAKFSSLLGLPSSLFDITVVSSSQPAYASGKPAFRRFVQDSSQDVLLISGWGAGHGIGMSQWGAKVLAERANAGNNQYFKEILTHYYSGTKVEKWYK